MRKYSNKNGAKRHAMTPGGAVASAWKQQQERELRKKQGFITKAQKKRIKKQGKKIKSNINGDTAEDIKYQIAWNNFVKALLDSAQRKIDMSDYGSFKKEVQKKKDEVTSRFNAVTEEGQVKGGKLVENFVQCNKRIKQLANSAIFDSGASSQESFSDLQAFLQILSAVDKSLAEAFRELMKTIMSGDSMPEEEVD